jgi:hypothetical protein
MRTEEEWQHLEQENYLLREMVYEQQKTIRSLQEQMHRFLQTRVAKNNHNSPPSSLFGSICMIAEENQQFTLQKLKESCENEFEQGDLHHSMILLVPPKFVLTLSKRGIPF